MRKPCAKKHTIKMKKEVLTSNLSPLKILNGKLTRVQNAINHSLASGLKLVKAIITKITHFNSSLSLSATSTIIFSTLNII